MADKIVEEGIFRNMKLRDMGDNSYALVVAEGSSNASPDIVKAAPWTPISDQQIADATLANATLLTVPADATVAIVQNTGNATARWRTGNDPTTTRGQRLLSGERLTLDLGNAGLAATKFIRESTGVTLEVFYYK